ncbi:hypothetical protein C6W19_02030 [Bacillus sp. RJGP41]|nr:hypothetical protein C6W19_02030 [Bacillus sp. RJGP41]
MVRKVRDSCGKTCPGETPQAQRRRGRTARGKRVPGVEIQLDYLYPLIKSITIAKTIIPISNNGPMPELYTKYTVMWRKMSTTRNRNNRKHKIMIRAVFLFRYK